MSNIAVVHRSVDGVIGGGVHVGRTAQLEEPGGSMGMAPSMTGRAFIVDMLVGFPDPRCVQCVREQGSLTVVGDQMDDVATARRALSKHNSYGFGTISTHLPTTPLDLAYARVATLHLHLPVPGRAPTRCSEVDVVLRSWACCEYLLCLNLSSPASPSLLSTDYCSILVRLPCYNVSH